LIREFRRQFRSTGALLPSSRFLARALVSELRRKRPSARILEVGPGTGSVTREIIRFLQSGDQVDLVEINPQFVAFLHKRFEKDWAFRFSREQFHIVNAPVEKFPGAGCYDYIISGLPLNNFPVHGVREIFKAYSRLLKPGGTLTYYEYVLVRQLKTPFCNRKERRRLFSVGRLVRNYIQAFQIRKEPILINVPPAIVRHLRLKPLETGEIAAHVSPKPVLV
jgi:phospholipid N-methyltransferase